MSPSLKLVSGVWVQVCALACALVAEVGQHFKIEPLMVSYGYEASKGSKEAAGIAVFTLTNKDAAPGGRYDDIHELKVGTSAILPKPPNLDGRERAKTPELKTDNPFISIAEAGALRLEPGANLKQLVGWLDSKDVPDPKLVGDTASDDKTKRAQIAVAFQRQAVLTELLQLLKVKVSTEEMAPQQSSTSRISNMFSNLFGLG